MPTDKRAGMRLKAKIENGNIRCPRCKSLLGKAYYGAQAGGIELWCRACHKPILVELNKSGH